MQTELYNSANKKKKRGLVMRRCHVVNSPSNYIQFHLFLAWINFLRICYFRDSEAPHQITSTRVQFTLDISCHYYSLLLFFSFFFLFFSSSVLSLVRLCLPAWLVESHSMLYHSGIGSSMNLMSRKWILN